MATEPLVIVPHVECGPWRSVVATVRDEYAWTEDVLTPAANPFSYATLIRRAWRSTGDLVVIEGDVLPNPGSVRDVLHCPEPWCVHQIWLGDHWAVDTLGFVKFSAQLRADNAALIDRVCAPQDPRYWVRRGWTRLPADCSVDTLNNAGKRATLRPGAPASAASADPARRPTTHDWLALDVDIYRQLLGSGATPHVHHDRPTHMHDYQARPVGERRPWWLMEYGQHDWQAIADLYPA